jgi:ParB family chromosome partitioning protein
MLRLLKLSEKARQALAEGELSMGHGRALLGLDDASQQESALLTALSEKLSVRELEKLVRKLKKEGLPEKVAKIENPEMELQLQKDKEISAKLKNNFTVGTRIRRLKNGCGRIELDFKSPEEFQELLQKLGCE